MRRGIARSILCLIAALGATTPVRAQPVTVPDTWGGDFWSRPRLTGSWGGLRDEMGKKGVVLDLDLLLMPQGVLSGGRDTDAGFWGGADYTLNVDTGKLGLWPGGFLRVYAATTFGDSVERDTGALVPVNTAMLFPKFDEPSTSSWLGATLDIQVIEPALTKKLSSSGGSLEDVGTTVVAGLRFYVRF